MQERLPCEAQSECQDQSLIDQELVDLQTKMILVEDLKEVVHAYDILEQLEVEYPPDEVWVIEVRQVPPDEVWVIEVPPDEVWVIEVPQVDQAQGRQKSQDWVWCIEASHHP